MIRTLREWLDSLTGLFVYRNPIASDRAPRWRAEDLARLRNVPGICPECLGRLIAAGFQHRIYEYDSDGLPRVCKLSIPRPLLRFPTPQEAQEDVELVSRFLAPYAVQPAQAIPLPDGSFALIQRRLAHFHSITQADLTREPLREQFMDVAQRNRAMLQQAGRSLDFLGREGQRKSRAALLGLSQTPVLSNLVVEEDGAERIRVVDTDLENFRWGGRSLRDARSRVAAWLAYQMNRLLIKRFFGVDIDSPGRA